MAPIYPSDNEVLNITEEKIVDVSTINKLRWRCFYWLFHRLCLYHRMKAVLWTKQEHHKKMEQNLERYRDSLDG